MNTAGPLKLGVNIDHVATLRQARGTAYPSPAEAAVVVEQAGADSITVHLREDRRHIQDRDLVEIGEVMRTRMNLEMAVTDPMLEIATQTRPADCCLVPEKREELTTEGGLDVVAGLDRVQRACRRLSDSGIRVSLFIDPDREQIGAALDSGAPVVELHTGRYADAAGAEREAELARIIDAAHYANDRGLTVHAGHGLHYDNVVAIAGIEPIVELNIGHAIVARAVFDGLHVAVGEMKRLMSTARSTARGT